MNDNEDEQGPAAQPAKGGNKRERLALLLLLFVILGLGVTWGVKWGLFYREQHNAADNANQPADTTTQVNPTAPTTNAAGTGDTGTAQVKDTSATGNGTQQANGTGGQQANNANGQQTNTADGGLNADDGNLNGHKKRKGKKGSHLTGSPPSGSAADASAATAKASGQNTTAPGTGATSADTLTTNPEKQQYPTAEATAADKEAATEAKTERSSHIVFEYLANTSCDVSIVPVTHSKKFGNIKATRFVVKYTGDADMTSVQIVINWQDGDKNIASQIANQNGLIHKNDKLEVDGVNIPKVRKSWKCIRFTIQFSNAQNATEAQERTQCWP